MVRTTILFLALGLVQNADAFSAPVPQQAGVTTGAPPAAEAVEEVEAPPAAEREMPPPYGAVSPVVQAVEGRIPGTHNQAPGNKWWEPAGMYGTHSSIKTSSGIFQTYTDAMKNDYNPKTDGPSPPRVAGAYNQQATGNWWDRAAQVQTHSSIQTSNGFQVYSDSLRGPDKAKDDGPNPPRVAGAYNQQSYGNWWDRPGQINTHESIKTSNGFQVYSDSMKGPGKAKDDGPEPARISGAYNQQATGNWWDRPGKILTHDTIQGSSGTFQVYSDVLRESSQ